MASGFNVVDFMELPSIERRIMRLVLREVTMSYPQLCEAVAAMPAGQETDQANLDSALDHLTRTGWLVSQGSGQQTLYRANTMHRTSSQGQGLWDNLDLDMVNQPKAFRLDFAAAEIPLAARRGGKRLLPTQIWDRLSASEPTERPGEPPAARPARRTGLLDKLMDDDGGSKEK